MLRNLLLVFGLFFVLDSLKAQEHLHGREPDPYWIPREHVLDFQQTSLRVSFMPQEGKVIGEVRHIFQALRDQVSTFELDAKNSIILYKASLNGKSIAFIRLDSNSYIFTPNSPLSSIKKDTLLIQYEAKPKRGLYFVGWNLEGGNNRKQIYSQGQGIDNRCWIPMYDEMNDKIISDMHITFDSSYQVLSNGDLLSVQKNGSEKTWHYQMNKAHAPYLMMLAIGKYAIDASTTESGIPVKHYYYPEDKDSKLEPTYRHSKKIFSFLEKEIGVPYPWKTYAQIPVRDYMFGAMENTTATVFGDFYCVDNRSYQDRNYVGTNAHELVHMWFGDCITARSASHSWLQESFATHYQWLSEKMVFGQDHFDWLRRTAVQQSLLASLTDKKPIAHAEAGSIRWYPKGAYILQMLKYILGKKDFDRVIQYYLSKHAYGSVDTHEFMLAFQDVLGRSMNVFFDQWILHGGEPSFALSYEEWTKSKTEKETRIKVQQTHLKTAQIGIFTLPVVVKVWYQDGSMDSLRVQLAEETQILKVPNPKGKKIDFVLFDPNMNILKTMVFEKSPEEWRRQALKAPHMLDRYEALLAMKTQSNDQKRKTLEEMFAKESFHAMKSEILLQLMTSQDSKVWTYFESALQDKAALVRKASLNLLHQIPYPLQNTVEKMLQDSSYLIQELALEKLCTSFPNKKVQYLSQTQGQIGNYAHNLQIKWLELSAQSGSDTTSVQALIRYAAPNYDFRTRDLAFQALRRGGIQTETSIMHALQAACHFNNRMAKTGDDYLTYISKQTEVRVLMAGLLKKHHLSEEQQVILQKILKTP